MTCRDKYVKDHPGMLLRITRSGCIPPECPSNYGYLEDPCYCDPDSACRLCWEREIPKNEEKENENMSPVTAYARDLEAKNYEAQKEIKRLNEVIDKNCDEIENLKELIRQKDVALLASMNQHADDEERNKNLLHERNMYRYGLHVVEAFLGRDILEED